jgi:hypothetical protein
MATLMRRTDLADLGADPEQGEADRAAGGLGDLSMGEAMRRRAQSRT